jgi:hypothetical protein
MNQTYAAELVRRLAAELKEELNVQPILTLQIKLHLERLKLMELICAANEKDSPLDPHGSNGNTGGLRSQSA